MKKSPTAWLLKYGITSIVGALMAWATIELHGYADAATALERYRILADAFTIPGVVLMLCYVLVAVANEGAFEGISYALSYAVTMLIPGANKKHERYGDYVARKRERGGIRGFGFLFFVGAAYFVVALIFIALFYGEM